MSDAAPTSPVAATSPGRRAARIVAVVIGVLVALYGSHAAALGGHAELDRGNPIHTAVIWAVGLAPWLAAGAIARTVGRDPGRRARATWLAAGALVVLGPVAFVVGVIPFLQGL